MHSIRKFYPKFIGTKSRFYVYAISSCVLLKKFAADFYPLSGSPAPGHFLSLSLLADTCHVRCSLGLGTKIFKR